MRSGNPALSADVFRIETASDRAGAMTMGGTVIKTGVLLALAVTTAAIAWTHVSRSPELLMPYMVGGALVALAVGIALIFKPHWAPVAAPLYALAKGCALGAISFYANLYVQNLQPGTYIVPQAVALTFGTLAVMLVAYGTGLVRATEKFKTGVLAATGAIALTYLVTIVLGLFGIEVPYIHGSGLIGIGFSLFVVVIAALNLVLDFDLIENGVNSGAPKYMEWYGGYALLVTLVWLYIEFLRLLMKLQSRD